MERRDEIVELLERVAAAMRQASSAAALVAHEHYGQIVPVMEINAGVYRLLRGEESRDVEWMDDAIRFLINEFVPHADSSIAEKKCNLLPYHTMPQSRNDSMQLMGAFRELLAEQERLSSSFRHEPASCLVLAALPVEFRAFVRRARRFLRGSHLGHLGKILQPFLDEHKEEKEPAWLECILDNGAEYAKTVVLFPGRDGSLYAQKAITDYLGDHPQYFKHVLVVGVAGHLDKDQRLGMGDVVLSTGFFDTHRRKAVTKRSGEIDFSRKDPIKVPIECRINLKSWRPKVVYESKPRSRLPGFRTAMAGYVVSGPEVVKSRSFKAKLQEVFPDALAVEMEAAGCHMAVQNLDTPVTIIKGICDWSLHGKTSRWQPYSADIASALAVDYVLEHYGKKKLGGESA